MGGVYCDCIVSRNVTQFSASHVIDLQKAGAHSWELSQWGYWAVRTGYLNMIQLSLGLQGVKWTDSAMAVRTET